jgi:hypothetical protein
MTPWACDACGASDHSAEALRCGHCGACAHDPEECPSAPVVDDEARLGELRAMLATLIAARHAPRCACAECMRAAI